jgi:PKD domain
VKKPSAPLVLKPVPKPAAKPIVKVIKKVVTKTPPKSVIPPKKVVVKLPASVGSKTSTARDEASFTPDQLQAKAFPPAVAVSEPVYLSAPASVHYRVGTILGQPAQVRFTPIDSTWSFSDGSSAKGLNPHRSFATAGTYSASVEVRYLVSYRLAGSTTWITEAVEITLTDQAQIVVTSPQSNSSQPSKSSVNDRPYLVGENCLKNPSAFAC